MSALLLPAPAHHPFFSCLPEHNDARPPRALLHPPLAPGRAGIQCKAKAVRRQGPGLPISIQEVEAALGAMQREPQVPTWAKKEAAKAKKQARSSAPPAAPSRPTLRRLAALAARPRAAALGLTPDLCSAKLQELLLLLPGVSESVLFSLEEDSLLELMADTSLLAARLVELRTKLAAGGPSQHAAQPSFPRLLRDSLQHLCSSNAWDSFLRSRLPLATLQGHTGPVTAVAISSDGRRAVSSSQDGSLRLWDLQSLACTATLQGHTASVTAVGMSHDGRRAVSGSWDKSLRVWDLTAQTCVATLSGHTNKVAALDLTPDGRRAVSGSYDRTLRVWDLESQSCTAALRGHHATVCTVAVTPDGSRAVSGGYDEQLRSWDLQAQCSVGVIDTDVDRGLHAVSVAPDGVHAVAAHGSVLYVWDLQAGSARRLEGHRGAVRAVAVTADRRHAVSGGDDGSVRLWDLRTKACIASLRGHAQGVTAVAVTPDGRCAVSGGRDMALCVWDLQPHLSPGPGAGPSTAGDED